MTDQTRDHGLDRRALFGLAAGAAAIAGSPVSAAAAAVTAAPANPVEKGPGVPTVTAVVDTTSGRVQGLVSNGIHCFKGIRYGAPPVGPLRFMPPQKPERSEVILDCSSFGAPAIQQAMGVTAAPATDFAMQMGQVFNTPSELKIQNEDCLFLNVWTPATDGKKRPVMVWIHGGGFSYGSGGQPIYSGEGLARFGDVVTVSMNHRLNVFGYLHLADAMGPAYASSGTVGMQDLVLSLQWVRDNIEHFGGDPGNVMIMGQSGGGVKVSLLLAMPSAKGLFHKASIQSGPGLTTGSKEAAAAATKKLLDTLGIQAGDLKSLQSLPPQVLVAAASKVRAGGGPIVDGVAIPHQPFTPGAPDELVDVPILVGWVKDEPTIFVAGEPWFGRMTEADLQERIKPFGAAGQKLLAAVRKAYPDYSPTYLFTAMLAAQTMQGSETLAARKAAKGGAPAYVWTLNWETPVINGAFKTPHTMEIPFMLYSFDQVRTYVGPGPQPKHMADQMAGAWVAFARTGKPDCAAIPHWPAFDAASRSVMVFNLKSQVVADPLPEVRQVLETLPLPRMPMG